VPISSRLLGEDEEVLIDVRLHWLFFIGPGLLSALAVIVALAVMAEFPNAPLFVGYLLGAMVLIPVVWLLARIVRWLGISLVVTTERIIYRRGVFGRDLIQLRLRRVTEVQCAQTLWGRLVGCGQLVVELQGEDPLVLADVRRPRVVQRVLNDQLHELGHGWADEGRSTAVGRDQEVGAPSFDPTPPHGVVLAGPAVAVSPPPSNQGTVSIHEQLIQLDDLRRRGILSEGEFESKKAELLSRL
jgi:hypothetical protein